MSLRYVSRVIYQSGMRIFQGMKDQGSKCDHSITIKSLRGDSSASSSSSKQARRTFSTTASFKAANTTDKLKRAEESLRIVMYLSCWGPN